MASITAGRYSIRPGAATTPPDRVPGAKGAIAAALLATLLAGQASAGAEHRGGVLRLGAYQAAGTIDPMINYSSDFWQLFSITQDGLLAFAKAEDAAGLRLVPDLAEAMPELRDGGLTYVFHLRRGVRFSDGRALGVADVVASFQRMFRVSGPNVGSWYSVIVGAPACLETPATCRLEGVQGDAAASTITIRLVRPDAEFPQKIALPFASILPADTPPHDLGTVPPAATGPYMIASYAPQRGLVMVRNPYFRQWSQAAQPDGYVDRIETRYGLQAESEVSAIENGSLDWMADPPPLDRLDEIGSRYAAQAHLHPMLAYYYVVMNTRLAPFDDVRVRRAVALAINRRVAVELYGGPGRGTPICQLLPAGIPGHIDNCPFTANPGPRWTAPDLARARALVAASGTAGMRVTLICSDRDVEHSMGIYLQSVLSDLGYAASVHAISYSIRETYLGNSANHVQIGLADWYQDYPAASDFLQVMFSCAAFHPGSDASVNKSGFCDPRIDARMQAALDLELTDAGGADRAWAGIDADLTAQAPGTTLFQISWLDLVSRRVGNFRFSPLFHAILSQMWVR